MIKLETNLARRAINLEEFREFMICEMNLTGEELDKLSACPSCPDCGDCWGKTKFLPRSIEKINAKLNQLLEDGKIRKSKMEKTQRFDDPLKAIEFIKELGNPEVIFIAHQK